MIGVRLGTDEIPGTIVAQIFGFLITMAIISMVRPCSEVPIDQEASSQSVRFLPTLENLKRGFLVGARNLGLELPLLL